MRRSRTIAAALGLGLGLSVTAALPAMADDTIVTFSITTAGLTINAPSSANLGSVPSGTTSISGPIGPVTVTDLRGTLNGSWTAVVTGTDFTTGGGTTAETIMVANVSYAPGPATSTTGIGTFTPGPGGIINVPRVAFTGTALQGNNSATWNPTLTVTIPASSVSGTYTGTVTHSVA
ncbi:hypothetical protein [Sphaerisporangium corydalis]|uniref:WxL domain-containing protein n=1 Tax=Sphaerisporangium corydalis TaxID=1441875 RepID=A0ABV9EA21_9ACTN|nr:hypothetical protein [Sphaerisporangium corydalis]